jgi:hypothetical protein
VLRSAAFASAVSVAFATTACSTPHVGPPWLDDAHILVQGVGVTNKDCRADICQHNENVDVVAWNGAIWLVHRTAMSQILGPNCSWFVYRSTDGGKSFQRVAHLLGPTDRDLRDPHFYIIGKDLYIYGGARLPGVAAFDNGIDAIERAFKSSDGVNWQSLGQVGPEMWTFWRPKLRDGIWYNAAYHDDDSDDALFSSTDGVTWTLGPDIYNMPADHEDETELQFMPSGALLALVRLDGTAGEALGDQGRLRTKVCWSMPPYVKFTCPQELDGERLDGPLSFLWRDRLFVIARKHLQSATPPKKRTALFEITGDFLNAGTIGIKEWGELPSAGDTAYAGFATLDSDRILVAWYSGDIARDDPWILGQISETNIWQGVIDLSQLK